MNKIFGYVTASPKTAQSSPYVSFLTVNSRSHAPGMRVPHFASFSLSPCTPSTLFQTIPSANIRAPVSNRILTPFVLFRRPNHSLYRTGHSFIPHKNTTATSNEQPWFSKPLSWCKRATIPLQRAPGMDGNRDPYS
jgi:hypothetical protein